MPESNQGCRLPDIPIAVVVAVGLLIATAFCVRNLPWHLDNYDQAKQAYVSWEIASQGNIWIQHTPKGGVATKPPLLGWISWLLAEVLRLPWEVAWRLPSLVAAGLILWLLWRTASEKYGRTGALLAVAAFSLTLLTPRLATLVRTDMVLTATIFAAGLVGLRRVAWATPWDLRARLGLAGIVAASCFFKGPLIFAFVFLPLLVIAGVGRCGARPGLRRAWPGLWPWALGLIPFLAWLIYGSLTDEEFWGQVIVREFAGRFTAGNHSVHNNQPFYFYFVHLTHKLFPWSLVILGSLAYRPVRRRMVADDGTCYLVLWAGVALLVMSLVPAKRVDRVFPVVPVLALMIPACVEAWIVSRRWWNARKEMALAILLVLAGIVSGGYAILKPIQAQRKGYGDVAAFGREVMSEAEAAGYRIAAVSPDYEGLYLYLRGAMNCKMNRAVDLWTRGEIDGIVISRSRLETIEDKLGSFTVAATAVTSLPGRRNPEFVFVLKTTAQRERVASGSPK